MPAEKEEGTRCLCRPTQAGASRFYARDIFASQTPVAGSMLWPRSSPGRWPELRLPGFQVLLNRLIQLLRQRQIAGNAVADSHIGTVRPQLLQFDYDLSVS